MSDEIERLSRLLRDTEGWSGNPFPGPWGVTGGGQAVSVLDSKGNESATVAVLKVEGSTGEAIAVVRNLMPWFLRLAEDAAQPGAPVDVALDALRAAIRVELDRARERCVWKVDW